MTDVDLIIFDLDGTLIDSKKDIAHCVNWTLNDMGLPDIAHEVIYYYVGHGVRELMAGAIKEAHGEDGYERALRIFDKHYTAHLLDHTRLLPGMDEILDAYNKKDLAVITNKPQKYTDAIMMGLGLDDYFGSVLGREATKKPKPDPDPILKVLEILPAKKERTLIIGDTEIDIEAGKRAGVLTCGVLFGFGEAKMVRDAEPDFIVEEAKELLEIFA
jgi:phosphoglycolate phosphatase